MSEHVYKTIELTGSSKSSIEDAVHGAIERATKTVHNLRWFSVEEIRGHLEGDRVAHWQVTLKLGFTVEE